MFPMTISIHNPAQLNAVLAALSMGSAASATEPTTEQLIQVAKDRAVKADAPALVSHDKADIVKENQLAAPGKPTRTAAKPAASPAPSKPTAEAAVADAPAPSTAQPEPQSATAPAATATSAPDAEPITYDKVAAAITAMVKVNREHAVDTLAAFGVRKGPELKPAQYAAFLAALNEPEAVSA